MDAIFYDFIDLPSKTHLDSFGFLRVPGIFARVGVQNYTFNDGSTKRILRPIAEVEKSAKLFNMVPLTLDHPQTFVSPQNAKDLTIGTLSESNFSKGVLDGQFLVSDQKAIQAAQTSHKQLSAGYLAEVQPKSGIWVDTFGVQGPKGESYEYDFVQKDIRPNHVALVEKARAGSIASLQLDSNQSNQLVGLQTDRTIKGNKLMATTIIDESVVYTLDGEDAPKMATLISKLKSEITTLKDAASSDTDLKVKLQDTEKKLGELTAANSQLKTKVEELTKELETKTTDSSDLVAKLQIWNTVSPHLDGIEPDFNLPVTSVKKLYLVAKHPELTDTIKNSTSDGFIDGLWTAYKPSTQVKDSANTPDNKTTEPDGLEDIKKYFTQGKIKTQDSTSVDPIEASRQEYIKGLEQNYKRTK